MRNQRGLARGSHRRPTGREVLRLGSVVFLLCVAGGAAAQSQRTTSQMVPSELGRENLSLVGASAADIKAVLVKDSGLMVELKRWVAKDATDHGQVIGESDLTDDAIYDRLETDAKFRAVATVLLQRFGYLMPQVNPDSPLAKEQQLLIQERVKWITQEEEENRAEERSKRQKDLRDLQTARACAQGVTAACQQQQQPPTLPQGPPLNNDEGGIQPTAPAPEEIPLPASPGQPPVLGLPTGGDQLVRTQLVEPEEEPGTDYLDLADLGGTSGGGGTASPLLGSQSSDLSGFSPDGSSSLFSQNPGGTTSDDDFDSFGSPQKGSSNGGDFGSLDSLSEPPTLSDELDETDQQASAWSGLEAVSPSHPPGTPVVPLSPYNRPYQQSKPAIQPAMERVPNPYRNIPSLYDMYLQALPQPTRPRRFGMDVFENGTRDPQLIPMDLPAGPDYIVGPGDGLTVDLWGGVSHRILRTVDREGRISLPEVGPVLVSGKSLADAQQSIQQALRTQFRDISADVSLSRLRTIRVYEVGEVAKPGAYDVSSLSTPLNGLFAAGGPTARGSLRIVKHYRGDQLVETVDLYDLLLHGVKGNIQPLDNGDTILVPPVGPQVTVEGMVRRPAVYELKDEKDLASVLELAGGLLPTAALGHIEVQRLVVHDKRTMLSLEIRDGADEAEVTKKLASFEIQDGDDIRVFPIAQGNEDAVYLEGHVVRPGRYAYRADMRVTDIVSSFQELLPEPAMEYAEIIRLNAPDFHPTVESFNLSDALANPAQAPTLHPMDTIRIFSRFDFENPPTVSVLGDVRKPGTFRTSGLVHISDAVHLAGGLAPDAQEEDAQVFRYLPDGESKIFSVSLTQALNGNSTENLLLEPRDRLLIHRSTNAEQPATVYVEGAVGKPGHYPLTTNMTVADLIRVGGGLTPSADTQVADLTSYGWSGSTRLSGQHDSIELAAALDGDPKADLPLHNGDVVTVGQKPGWDDLGASITVRGEVTHPGTYGIRPGERLSSVLERAGGFGADAYPYGAVLQRVQVRELESKQQDQLLLRVKDAQRDLEAMPEADPQQKQSKEAALAQYQTTVTELSSNSPVGRVNIRISSNIKQWRNTSADIEVRAGDTLLIPKRPDYVMVTGQVFNATAVSYRPGKSARWYLSQSGGPTLLADKKDIFVVRADGSVISKRDSFVSGDSLSATLLPGDTVVVPEKAAGGGASWQSLFTSVQIASSIIEAAVISIRY
jgi:polysaccharide biosynthesis/export protein